MKHYKQLTIKQRYQIYGLKQAGLNQTQIAQKFGLCNPFSVNFSAAG